LNVSRPRTYRTCFSTACLGCGGLRSSTTSSWIYNGVTLNPMYFPVRRLETANVELIYRNHPLFADADFQIWYSHEQRSGDAPIEDFGRASLEGGDVMPIGNGTVLLGISERTPARMVELFASKLFEAGAVERVIACDIGQDRAHMHLDTVITMLDVDAVTIYPQVVDRIKAYSLRPLDGAGGGMDITPETSFLDALKDALKIKQLRVVGTGRDDFHAQREQWDDGNNLLAVEPGVVVAYSRNEYEHETAKGGYRGDHDRRVRVGAGAGRPPLHDVPPAQRPGLGMESAGDGVGRTS